MYKSPSELSGPEEQFLQTRTVLLFGEVTPALAQTVSQQLLLLAARSQTDIKLVVNAQGGAVSLGEALFDLISGIGARVKVIGAGAVSQAAALAFAAPPRAQRYSLPHARYALFQDLGGTGGLTGSALAAAAEEQARHRQRLHALFARQTGQPVETIARDMERPSWLSADEAVGYGLVGQLVAGMAEV